MTITKLRAISSVAARHGGWFEVILTIRGMLATFSCHGLSKPMVAFHYATPYEGSWSVRA